LKSIKSILQKWLVQFNEFTYKIGFKQIDRYILKKFLGTFVYSIILVMSVAIVFDVAEKIDDFVETKTPMQAIIFDYYLNFIPYFTILFSHLFTFISVVFFTSKLAYRTEIIAILSSGVSYKRMLVPYMWGATFIAIMSYLLMNFVIPNANKVRLEFEDRYIHNSPFQYNQRNIHKQVRPGMVIYMESYSNSANTGYKVSIENFENGTLKSKLMGDFMTWDSTKSKWTIRNYYIRTIDSLNEKITKGKAIDTTLYIYPGDFKRRVNVVESMDLFELNAFIEEQEL